MPVNLGEFDEETREMRDTEIWRAIYELRGELAELKTTQTGLGCMMTIHEELHMSAAKDSIELKKKIEELESDRHGACPF